MTELYIRRAQPIEAQQFTGGALRAAEIDSWLDLWGDVRYVSEIFIDSKESQYIDGEHLIPVIQIPEFIMIMSDSGNYHVLAGSWIVKDSTGVLQILSDVSFHNTYERYTTDD